MSRSRKAPPLRPGLVASLAALAQAAEMSRNTIGKWAVKPDFPAKVNGAYDVWLIAKWHRDYEFSLKMGKADIEPGDPMLAGGNSPALERFRAARASIAELELEQKRGNLMVVAEVEQGLSHFCKLIRDSGETLRRQFGQGAYEILDRALDRCEASISELFGPDDDDEDDVPAGAVAGGANSGEA